MKELEKLVHATNIPWYLLGALLPVSLALGIFYSPSPMGFGGYLIVALTTLYLLLLAFLCFQGSPSLLEESYSSVAEGQKWWRFIPALLGMSMIFVALIKVVKIFLDFLPHFASPLLTFFFYSPIILTSLGMYTFYISAILLLPIQNLSILSRLRIFLTSLIIFAVIEIIYFYFHMIPVFVKPQLPLSTLIVLEISKRVDLILIVYLFLVALRAREAILRYIIVLLGIAMMASLADHIMLVNWPQIYAVKLAGLALVTVAAQTVSRAGRSLHAEELAAHGSTVLAEETGLPTRWKRSLTYILILIFALLVFSLCGGNIFGSSAKDLGLKAIVVVGGGSVILILLVLRQSLAMYEVNNLKQELRAKNAQLEGLATTDPLTGALNHRTLVDKLDEELVHAQEKGKMCSILFIDIDRFKDINDWYGHMVGDLVLCQFIELVTSILRPEDRLGRWGGDEFVAVLPQRDLAEACTVAEGLRTRVAQQMFGCSRDLPVTCSLGVATYPSTASEREHLLSYADQALYVAKLLGRNQVRTADEPEVRGF